MAALTNKDLLDLPLIAQRMKEVFDCKAVVMKIFFLSKEAVLLEFKRVNGSGWLTNHRLILLAHARAHGYAPNAKGLIRYSLNNFQEQK